MEKQKQLMGFQKKKNQFKIPKLRYSSLFIFFQCKDYWLPTFVLWNERITPLLSTIKFVNVILPKKNKPDRHYYVPPVQ